MRIPKHNTKSGLLNKCQICNLKIKTVFNFGYQPLADDLKNKIQETVFFPIEIGFCQKCILLQNNYIVDDRKLYNKNYHYRPGITKNVLENFKEMANKIKKLYNLNSNSIVADIGCNDGSLLLEFKKKKIYKLIGIEPTNTIKFVKSKGIRTLQNYMNEQTAAKAKKFYGKIDVITTTNVFAHTNKLKDFIIGVKKLIKDNGVFIIENHYLGDIIKKKQFDSFYHEHLRTYSLTSLIKLMKYYGFHAIDAYTSDRYGGNIQAHFSLKKNNNNLNNINKILRNEKKIKLDKISTYIKFYNEINKVKNKIDDYLLKNKDKKIIAKAFPARASVLLHYFSSIKDHIDFIAEQPTSLKLNKYAPGTSVPILSEKKIKKYKPDIIIVLAWHLFQTIKNKWKKKLGNKVKIIKILPKLEIF